MTHPNVIKKVVTCYIIDLSFAITISCWFGACAALQPFTSAGLGKPKGKSALRLLSCLSNQAVQLQLISNKDQLLKEEKSGKSGSGPSNGLFGCGSQRRGPRSRADHPLKTGVLHLQDTS